MQKNQIAQCLQKNAIAQNCKKCNKIYRRWQIAQLWQKKKSQYFAKFAKRNSTLRNICQSYYTACDSQKVTTLHTKIPKCITAAKMPNRAEFAKECHCTEFQKVHKIYKRWQIPQIWQKKAQYFAKFAKRHSTSRNICQSYYTARYSEMNYIHNIVIFSVRQSEDGGKHPCF